MLKQKQKLDEKVEVGGGETGKSTTADPTGVRATLPKSNLSNGEPMQKIQDPNNPGVEDTDSETNTKAGADKSAANKASVSMKEDMAALFQGEELTEEFKEKATTIFEAAVNVRVEEIKAQLEEETQVQLEEQVTQFVEETNQRIDEYLNYVVEQWMEQNELAVEHSLRTEITESFIEGMKTLFQENYIDVPEEKADVIGELSAQVEELEQKLNEQVQDNIELKKSVDDYRKQAVFAEVAEGLTATQVDKFTTLAEGVDYNDAETYKRKLEIVKENYFVAKKVGSDIVESEIEDIQEDTQPHKSAVDPSVARYMQAISRTIKK